MLCYSEYINGSIYDNILKQALSIPKLNELYQNYGKDLYFFFHIIIIYSVSTLKHKTVNIFFRKKELK